MSDKNPRPSSIAWLYIIAVAILISVWAAWPLLLSWIMAGRMDAVFTELNPGTWGDSYGTLTCFFGAITLALVFKTFMMQRDELTAAEQAAEKNHEVQEKEMFESTLYKLLQNHRNLVNESVILAGNEVRMTGLHALAWIWGRMEEEIKNPPVRDLKSPREIAEQTLRRFTTAQQDIAEEYTNSITLIFDFLSIRSPAEDEFFYAALVRQSLTNTERRMLMVMGHAEVGKKVKLYAEKFGLFHNLAFDVKGKIVSGDDPKFKSDELKGLEKLIFSYSGLAFERFASHLAFSKDRLPPHAHL